MLHIWAQSPRVAALLRLAFTLLPAPLQASAVVLITIVEPDLYGLDRAIFANEELQGLSRALPERVVREDLRRRERDMWRELTPIGSAQAAARKRSASLR